MPEGSEGYISVPQEDIEKDIRKEEEKNATITAKFFSFIFGLACALDCLGTSIGNFIGNTLTKLSSALPALAQEISGIGNASLFTILTSLWFFTATQIAEFFRVLFTGKREQERNAKLFFTGTICLLLLAIGVLLAVGLAGLGIVAGVSLIFLTIPCIGALLNFVLFLRNSYHLSIADAGRDPEKLLKQKLKLREEIESRKTGEEEALDQANGKIDSDRNLDLAIETLTYFCESTKTLYTSDIVANNIVGEKRKAFIDEGRKNALSTKGLTTKINEFIKQSKFIENPSLNTNELFISLLAVRQRYLNKLKKLNDSQQLNKNKLSMTSDETEKFINAEILSLQKFFPNKKDPTEKDIAENNDAIKNLILDTIKKENAQIDILAKQYTATLIMEQEKSYEEKKTFYFWQTLINALFIILCVFNFLLTGASFFGFGAIAIIAMQMTGVALGAGILGCMGAFSYYTVSGFNGEYSAWSKSIDECEEALKHYKEKLKNGILCDTEIKLLKGKITLLEKKKDTTMLMSAGTICFLLGTIVAATMLLPGINLVSPFILGISILLSIVGMVLLYVGSQKIKETEELQIKQDEPDANDADRLSASEKVEKCIKNFKEEAKQTNLFSLVAVAAPQEPVGMTNDKATQTINQHNNSPSPSVLKQDDTLPRNNGDNGSSVCLESSNPIPLIP